MKRGSGDDPFADDVEDEQPDQSTTEADGTAESPDTPETTSDEASTAASEEHSLPYYQRRTSVKEDRDDVLQFFVQEQTAQAEDDLEREVAAELDIRAKDLYKLDLREAALLVAMRHPDEIAAVLREWGYEYV